MRESEFQRSVSADMNTIVRLQREREQVEVCWICGGRDMAMVEAGCLPWWGTKPCPYCNGKGMVHVERKQ